MVLAPTGTFVQGQIDKHFPAVVSVALALWVWQLSLHIWQPLSSGDLRLWLPHGVAWLHDALVLASVAFVACRLRRSGWWLLLIFGSGLAIYPQLLRQSMVMQANLFATDAAAASTFLVDYLGVDRLWPAIGAIAIVSLGPRMVRPLRINRIFSISMVVVMAAALMTLPRSPHPLVSSLWQEATTLLSVTSRVVPSLQPVAGKGSLGTTKTTPQVFGKVNYQHVILVVLEGIPAADFERDFLQRRDGYYSRVKSQASYFANYRSTNLDSYTSLIAMTTGRQVPYRAYADPSSYEHINLADNLTRSLRANGYHSTFLSTYAHQPFIPTRDDWNKVLDRNNLDIGPQWLTLGNTRMEEAVEDKAAIAAMVDAAARQGRSFTLHEMVYGHSPEWQAKTGKTPSAYADEYLSDLTQQLAVKNLLNNSLIVVVSDHGERARMADPENYRVPLLVIGKTIESGTNSALFSHLDLPAMIKGWLTGESLPESRSFVDVVGSTERWVYGRLTDAGSFLFIDNARGSVMNASGGIEPVALHRDFLAKLVQLGIPQSHADKP